MRTGSGLQKSRAYLEARPSPINLEVSAEQGFLGNVSQRGGDFTLLFRRGGTDIQNIYFDLRLRRLLRARQRAEAE